MHPESAFDKDSVLLTLKLPGGDYPSEDKIADWKHIRNTLPNLQLLEGIDNERKSSESLVDWLSNPINSENVLLLPKGIDYSLANFDEFYSKRRKMMLEEYKKILL